MANSDEQEASVQARRGDTLRKRKTPPTRSKRSFGSAATGTSRKPPRKKPLTYTEAVGDIRDMFLQQAALWKDQSERLRAAGASNTPHDASLAQQEPWASLMDAKGRPSTVFREGENTEKQDEESVKVKQVKQKLKRARQWKYNRPTAPECEELDGSDDGSDEDR